MKSSDVTVATALLMGNLAYVLAVTSSFNIFQITRSGFTAAAILLLTIVAGISAIGLGFVSILLIGGRCSLGVANFIANITRSTHVIEYDNQSAKSKTQKLLDHTYLLYTAGLVFLLLVAIAWDLHNADGPHAGIFYPLLNATNIFLTRTDTVNPTRFSVNSLPLLFTLTALAGLTPSLTLPYLRNFKITSVNSGPFYTSLLFTVVGLVAGLSAILTIVGFIYKVLWASAARALPSYHFVLLVMVGFSIDYAVGTYLGRDRTERMIVESLEKKSAKSKIFFGTVDIKPRLKSNSQLDNRLRTFLSQTDSRNAQEKQAHLALFDSSCAQSPCVRDNRNLQ